MATFLSRQGSPLGGVVGMIGVQGAEVDWEKIDIEQKRQTPILVYNGDKDQYFPLDLAEQSYKEFLEKGLNFNFKVEPGLKHTVSEDGIKAVGEFLRPLMN